MPRLPVVLACALVVAALPPVVQAQPQPFDIDVSLPITGQLGFLGSETAKGVTALEAYVNARGGIRGRPVHFIIQDDQSNPQVEVELVSQELAKKPAVIIGGELVAMCNAASALLKPDGPVYYCFSSGVHPAPGSWIYSASFSTVDMVACAMRYLRESGMTKIAVLDTTDASGQDGDRTIDEALARPDNKPLEVVAREHFGTTDISVAAQLARIKASGAQAIIAWTSGTPLGTVLRGVRDSGFDIPVITTPANLVYKQLEQYKSVLPSSPLLIPGIPSVVPEAVADRGVRRSIADFYTAMKAQGVDRPDVAASIAWDVGRVVVDAYRARGFNATATQIRNYINNTRGLDNVLGVYDYTEAPQRGVLASWLVMVRWNADADKFVAVSKFGGAPLK